MSLQTLPALDVLETELADVNDWFLGELLGVGGEIPGLHPVPAQLDHVDVLHPGDDVVRPVARATARGVLLHAARGGGRRGTRRTREGGGAALCRVGLKYVFQVWDTEYEGVEQ